MAPRALEPGRRGACRRRCRSGTRASTPSGWLAAARAVAAAGGRLVSLWGADRRGSPDGGFAVCAAYALPDGLVWLDLRAGRRRRRVTPTWPRIFPVAGAHAARHGRPARHRAAGRRRHRALAGPWCSGPKASARCADASGGGRRQTAPRCHRLRVRSRRGRRRARDRGRPGARRHHRAGHFRFSVVGEKVLRLEAAPGLHAQGHRAALHRTAAARRRTGWPAACRATRRWPSPGPTAWRWNRPSACEVPDACAVAARA